ncbi:MAG: lysylphosphatidylglycerol synthase transmembrane domain-containing protein [Candidatus Omnitrophota bacterium]
MRKIISWAILALLISLGACYVIKHPANLAFLKHLSLKYFAIVSVITIFACYVRSLLTKAYMDYFGLVLPPAEWIGLDSLVSLINHLPVYGGVLSKAFYLKKQYDFSYARFTSFLGAINLLSFFTLGAAGLICIPMLHFGYGITSRTLVIIFSCVTAIPSIIFFMPVNLNAKAGGNRVVKFVSDMVSQWNALKKSGITVGKLILIQIAVYLVSSLKLYFIFLMLSLKAPFVSCFVITLVSSLAALVPITPAGMGLKEITAGITAKILGISLVEGTMASIIDRVITFFWVAIFGWAFVHFHVNRKAARV